jgi:hypothetical protein
MTKRCKTCGQKLPYKKTPDGKFDKTDYMRSYMRARRAVKKAEREKRGVDLKDDPAMLYEKLKNRTPNIPNES